MKTIFTIPLTFFFLLSITTLFSQENNSKNTIDAQFEKLMETSNSFKGYKVVGKNKLNELRENTNKKISTLQQEIVLANNAFRTQKTKNSSLTTSLIKTKKELKTATQAKNQIALLGFPTSKATFRISMWSIVLVLSLLLFFFIYQYKNSHLQTKIARKNLQVTEDEFEEHRKSALEKQQKMGRMLQDERNKASEVLHA